VLIVRSPVRVSFAGGGTDLPVYYEKYGGAVLSTSINKYFYTILSRRDDNYVQIISSDLRTMEHWQDIAKMSLTGNKLELPLAVLKSLGRDVAVNLFLASEIPPGTGLGSSATVCVNLLKALTTYLHLPASKYDIAEKAFAIARDGLGKPVGKQDEYAAAFGGLNFIRIDTNGTTHVEALDIPRDVKRELQQNLMLFFTGTARDSQEILREQETSSQDQHGRAVAALHEIRSLAERMRRALVRGELNQFGHMLDEGWEAKKRISNNISNSSIDRRYQLAKERGALGGKITGAGGGGFLLLYCEQACQQSVRQALAADELPEMRFEFETEGAQVIVNDPFLDGDHSSGLRWNLVWNEPPTPKSEDARATQSRVA